MGKNYLHHITRGEMKSKLIERYPVLKSCEAEIVEATSEMISCFNRGGKLLIMGNGGSSSDAEHWCGELLKGFLLKRPLTNDQRKLFPDGCDIAMKLQQGLPAISLGVAHSVISATANDIDHAYGFAQQIWGLANKEDIVIGISTSGNSKNVVNGLKTAKAKGVKTISLTGEKESDCSRLSDITIKAPAAETHIVQELHLPIYHAICIDIEDYFYGNR